MQGSSVCFRKALTRVGSETTKSVPICTSLESCTERSLPAPPPGRQPRREACGFGVPLLASGRAALHLPAGRFRARCLLGDEVSPWRFCAQSLPRKYISLWPVSGLALALERDVQERCLLWSSLIVYTVPSTRRGIIVYAFSNVRGCACFQAHLTANSVIAGCVHIIS